MFATIALTVALTTIKSTNSLTKREMKKEIEEKAILKRHCSRSNTEILYLLTLFDAP